MREPNTEQLTETRSWKGCPAVITVLDVQVALRLKGSQEAVGSAISKAVSEIVMLPVVFLFLFSSRKQV